jgi:TolA-binding protein
MPDPDLQQRLLADLHQFAVPRHARWDLSLTDGSGKAPKDPNQVEQRIRSLFGVPSESTRIRERQERLKELEQKQEDINKRLETSQAEASRESPATRRACHRAGPISGR